MAKIVRKAAGADSDKPKPASSRNASGAGFSKTFSPAELKEIENKRREMRQRLYAAG